MFIQTEDVCNTRIISIDALEKGNLPNAVKARLIPQESAGDVSYLAPLIAPSYTFHVKTELQSRRFRRLRHMALHVSVRHLALQP
jgi:hypothetical protein